ncbi:MAG TPA: DUF4340 domain-containing protein [Bryobacteraceae bacterium]|jgi:hypothetical protein|nr:DUF4340 domain-containing protein [Bryobacteraceae bacterium]
MKPQKLLVAAVLLAGLSGLVWYAKQHPPAASTSPAAESPKVVDIPDASVKSVDLRRKDGSSITLEKEEGKWTITTPEHWKADQDAATTLLSSLHPVSADSVVENSSSDLTKYGLNKPSLDVTVHLANGKSDELLFGDDVPAGSLVYVRTANDPKIYAVASSVKTSLDKSANDLRDKRLLTFDQNHLTRIDLMSGKSDIEFGKNNANEWQMLKPQPYRVDSFQVEELLRKLTDAKMDLTGNADDAKKSAAAFASGTPVSKVEVADSSGVQTLDVRKQKEDYYAKSSVVPGIYKVSSDLGKAIDNKQIDDFRNKKIFDFGFSDPTKIVVSGSGVNKAITRAGTDWKSNNQTMDAGDVQALIDRMRDLTATKFDTAGFTQPALTLSVTSNEGKRVEKVEFAKVDNGYIARRENQATLYQLDAKPVNDILEASKTLKTAKPGTKK